MALRRYSDGDGLGWHFDKGEFGALQSAVGQSMYNRPFCAAEFARVARRCGCAKYQLREPSELTHPSAVVTVAVATAA